MAVTRDGRTVTDYMDIGGPSAGGPTISPAEALVRRAYAQIGMANPDAEGVRYWTGQNLSEADLLKNMGYSQYVNNNPGFSPAAAAPSGTAQSTINSTLYQDPAYAAYMRKQNLQEADIENSRIAAQERLRQQNDIALSGYAQQERQSMRNLANQYESRGMYRSGGRLLDQGEAAAEYGRQRSASGLALAEGVSGLQNKAGRAVADLRNERGEQEIEARKRLTQRDMSYG